MLPAASPSCLLVFRRKVARVERAIDTVSEAGDFLLVGEHVADFFLGGVGRAAGKKKLHDILVCPAMQRAFERGDRAGDGGVHVGKRRRDHPSGERAGVHPMLGVQHEARIHHAHQRVVRLFPVQHVQKIRCDAELGIGLDRFLAIAQPMECGDDRGELRGQVNRLALISVGVVAVKIGIALAQALAAVRSTSIGSAPLGSDRNIACTCFGRAIAELSC